MTPISRRAHTFAPAVAHALPPVAAALLAIAFALVLVRSLLRRVAGQKALWAIGFALFAVAAVSEALAQRSGWSPGLFRTYYVAGGVLTVAYLGAGSAWLLLPRRGRDVLTGALVVATVAAVTAVLLAPVDAHALTIAPTGKPPPNAVSEDMPSCGRSRSTPWERSFSWVGRCCRSFVASVCARTSGSRVAHSPLPWPRACRESATPRSSRSGSWSESH